MMMMMERVTGQQWCRPGIILQIVIHWTMGMLVLVHQRIGVGVLFNFLRLFFFFFFFFFFVFFVFLFLLFLLFRPGVGEGVVCD